MICLLIHCIICNGNWYVCKYIHCIHCNGNWWRCSPVMSSVYLLFFELKLVSIPRLPLGDNCHYLDLSACDLRHGRSWYSPASTGLFLSDRGISTTMVSILPVKPATAPASRIFLITRLHGVWCTPGFRPWCHTFPSVLWRPAADYVEPWTLPASICWWLTDLWFLSSSGIHGVTITHLNVHW